MFAWKLRYNLCMRPNCSPPLPHKHNVENNNDFVALFPERRNVNDHDVMTSLPGWWRNVQLPWRQITSLFINMYSWGNWGALGMRAPYSQSIFFSFSFSSSFRGKVPKITVLCPQPLRLAPPLESPGSTTEITPLRDNSHLQFLGVNCCVNYLHNHCNRNSLDNHRCECNPSLYK